LIAVTVPDNTTVGLYYVTQTVTSKQGEYWLLEVSGASCPTVVVLPGDAIPVEVTPANPRPVLVNGTPGLLFYSKNISIKYILSPTISTGTGGSGGTNRATSQGGGPGGHGRNNILKTAVIALAIIVAGAGLYLYYQARKRRPSKTPGTLEKQEVQVRIGLDDRDHLILDALKDGEKTASELMTLTGIPKTPLYRRLKKLLEAGLIEAVDEGGQRVYRLKVGDKK
nr:winged helix-turn-helix domain-containing protein [Desulfurococcales archaeon]